MGAGPGLVPLGVLLVRVERKVGGLLIRCLGRAVPVPVPTAPGDNPYHWER